MTDKPAESVWDYPRPPALESSTEHVSVVLAGVEIVSTDASYRVLETSHPPTYYLPVTAFADGVLRETGGTSWCEWKGSAAYFDLVVGDLVQPGGAWTYPEPDPAYAALVGHVAIYPGRMDRCTIDGETVQPQPGGFYGGWITSRLVGPFKGAPGTLGW